MSLLNRVANQEVIDFLRTLTIKSTYFADKIRSAQIRPQMDDRVPETVNPYTIHLAGEYILGEIEETKNGWPVYADKLWPSKDRKRNKFKNYWKLEGDGLSRMSVTEMESISDPWKEGLYEIKPYIVKDVVDPVTGLKEDQYYYRSQLIYDRSGFLSYEARNSEYLNYGDDDYDQMMFVTSLDTHQTIPFTLENFYVDEANEAVAQGRRKYNHIHSKTLEAYRIPGKYFDRLCEKYPKQVDLIKAIVYRVPGHEISSLVTVPELENILLSHKWATPDYIASMKTRFKNKRDLIKKFGEDIEGARTRSGMSLSEYRRTRIAKAKNFTLLNYDYSTLDSTERISLLEHTHKVLDIINRRWAVNEYNFEENYAATLWSVLWTVLPTALIAKRYANIKTPYVSEGHMWDYLRSKGLASYQGYLTTEQTLFLYKNIEYLFQHAGQQKALNILVDNILADYGLTIKSKTVVLDTTDSLSKTKSPVDPAVQCASCSRYRVSCFKNMTKHLCDEWLGTKTLCKSEPVVLTEEFAGASESKILRQLVKEYGYTEEAARVKYKRSFIWKDDDVEAIKDDLNRDQMVDLDAHVDSLEDTIVAEHESNLEPVVNDDIVEQQRKELQHMHGTYAPTKLLEMSKKQYNVKYSELFNRFITETFLRFAPRKNADGTVTRKVTCSYKFDTTEGAASYLFDFGEMLAAGYLGFTKEYTVDELVDFIAKTEDGRPLYELVYDEEGNKIQIDTDQDGNPIYLKKLSSWYQKRFTDLMNNAGYSYAIPDKCFTTTALKFGKPVLQEELVRAWLRFDGKDQEDLGAIIETTDTIAKAGKQYYLKDEKADTFYPVDVPEGTDLTTIQYYQKKVTNRDANTRILEIRGTRYTVTQLFEPEEFCLTPDAVAQAGKHYYIIQDGKYVEADVLPGTALKHGDYFEEKSIWEEFAIRLKILGEFVAEKSGESIIYNYYENDNEIPLIPKYFKWYSNHLNPDMDASEEKKAKMKVNIKLAQKPIVDGAEIVGYERVEVNANEYDDIDGGFEDGYPTKDPMHQDGSLLFDTSKSQEYKLFRMDQFLDVSGLVDRWVDVMGVITDQSQIANYIDNMFEILEEVYAFAGVPGTIRTHLACREFLECIIKQTEVRFDLTGTKREHDTTEGGLCAFYSDWLKNDKELLGSFNVIEKLTNSNTGWNEFNTEIVKQLLAGCTIQYAQESVTKTQYAKLKQLVQSLSSYRINFIDNAETGQVCNDTVAVAEDAMITKVESEDLIYFDPIGDSVLPPRVGGYEQMDENWCILVPTSDLRRVADKVYYTLTYMDSPIYDNPDARQVLHPKARPLGTPGPDVPEGKILSVGGEAINLPANTVFQFYRRTADAFKRQAKNYFEYVAITGGYIPAKETCFEKVRKDDVTEELPEDVLIETVEGVEYVYRVLSAFEEIAVGDRLPTGQCFEKINLYAILGITEGTPLLISKVDNKWYYSTGSYRVTDYRLTGDGERHDQKDYYIYTGSGLYRRATSDDFSKTGGFVEGKDYYELSVIPCSEADVNDPNFNTAMYLKGDRFDLHNDFSNEKAKAVLDSTIYRLNAPLDCIDWSTPVQSSLLEHWLYPTVNHEFILTESKEPSILIEESDYPEVHE